MYLICRDRGRETYLGLGTIAASWRGVPVTGSAPPVKIEDFNFESKGFYYGPPVSM